MWSMSITMLHRVVTPSFQDCRDVFDFEGDRDVDLSDFAGFAEAYPTEAAS